MAEVRRGSAGEMSHLASRVAPSEMEIDFADTDGLEDEPESEEFLHSLFRSYYRPIYYLFLRQGLSPQDSDDLAQETFLRVWAGFQSFRNDSSLQTWIFKIAVNVLRKKFRHDRAAKRQGDLVSLDSPAEEGEAALEERLPDEARSDDHPLSLLLREEQRRALFQGMVEMPVQMRRCALLRYDRGLKYREIATVLGLSIQTVKSHLFQARERLRETLQEQQNGVAGGAANE